MPSYPFNGDAPGDAVVARLRGAFQSGDCYVTVRRHLVFVCGGATAEANFRTRFMEYAAANLPELNILLAEVAGIDFLADPDERSLNLATFEKFLAELADCLLIFPESPGSFAELGFFTNNERLLTKTLAVNRLSYQAADSFIALGPLALVNQNSDFAATLHADDDHAQTHQQISAVLRRVLKAKRRRHLPYQEWQLYPLKDRFFIIFELLRILRVMHAATLPHVLKEVFGGYAIKKEVKQIVSVLVAARLLTRAGKEERYLLAESQRNFVELPKEDDLILAANNYLLTSHRDLWEEVFQLNSAE